MNLLKTYLQSLGKLSDTEWNEAQPLFREQHIPRGGYYLREGQYCNRVSFLQSGLFKLFYLLEGKEKIMLFFQEGEFMSDYYGFLTQTPSVRPIQALEDSTLFTIGREDLYRLIDASQKWSQIGRALAESAYVRSVRRGNRLIHDPPGTRLATFLSEHPGLFQRIPQYSIASYLDMTPETLSRLKKKIVYEQKSGDSVH